MVQGLNLTLRVNPRLFIGSLRLGFYTTVSDEVNFSHSNRIILGYDVEFHHRSIQIESFGCLWPKLFHRFSAECTRKYLHWILYILYSFKWLFQKLTSQHAVCRWTNSNWSRSKKLKYLDSTYPVCYSNRCLPKTELTVPFRFALTAQKSSIERFLFFLSFFHICSIDCSCI